jgi:hypothetical protein
MEAYMIDFDLRVALEADVDRDSVWFQPFGRWTLETGGAGRVPEEWLKHWPSRAVARPSVKPTTAWINAAGYCACPEVKEVIEQLAPSVHQFAPLVLEAGPEWHRKEYPYFSIHVADRADQLSVEQSNVNWRVSKTGGEYWTKRSDSPLALPSQSIYGKHIWWNRKANILLISGELHDRLIEGGLASGLKLQKQIVV